MIILSGMVRPLTSMRARELDEPLLAPLWSPQFSFSKCHAVKKVMKIKHKVFNCYSILLLL